jgi:L-fuculose-phosphate aldolase
VAGLAQRPERVAAAGGTLWRVLEILAATVAEAYRSLSTTGLVAGAEGSVSVAERMTGVALVTALGLMAAEATADGIATVSLDDGRHLDGPLPTSELPTHLALLRTGHGAVVHAHAPHATALGLIAERIPLVLSELATRNGGPAPVLPYLATGTEALGAAVADALQANGVRACAIRNHGVVAAAPDVLSALAAVMATEQAARVTILARAAGGDPAELPADEIVRLRALGGFG